MRCRSNHAAGVDVWAAASPTARRILGSPSRPVQFDFFRPERLSAALALWAAAVAQALNAALPSRATASANPPAPLPTRALAGYVRHGRCPDPRDPLVRVPALVWSWYLAAVAAPPPRVRAVSPDELARLLRHLLALRDYALALQSCDAAGPVAACIARRTPPLRATAVSSPIPFEPQPTLDMPRSGGAARRLWAPLAPNCSCGSRPRPR